MAIAPLSDIVLDVAGAADPIKRQQAAERLAKLAATARSAASDFSDMVGGHASSLPVSSAGAGVVLPPGGHFGLNEPYSSHTNKVYQKFEAVFLQNFVESMLPKDEDLFGDTASADISRSMMAEQLAQQLAKTGRLGIASKILAAHAPAGPHHAAAVPPPASSPPDHASSAVIPSGPLDIVPNLRKVPVSSG